MRFHKSERTRALPIRRVPVLWVIVFAGLVASSKGVKALPADVKDHGVFVLTLAGKQVGTESFEIRPSKGQVEAEAKVELRIEQDGKSAEYKTSTRLVLTPDLQAQTYQWNQKGAQSSQLEMDLRGASTSIRYKTVSGENDAREFQLPRDVIILDNNVIHHYQLVLARFRQAGGGKQAFSAFIPQQALPGNLIVEEKERAETDVGGRQEKLRHLVVTTDNAQIDLWADDHDRLQKISIPAAQLEVVRKK